MVKPLPEKTVERLSAYRRTLNNCLKEGKTHIYSHELARLQHITPEQVRRDIMFIGYSSRQRKGYDIPQLVSYIGQVLDSEARMNMAIVGLGNLGMAIAHYFRDHEARFDIAAAFDVDPAKIGHSYSGIHCYSPDDLEQVIREKQVTAVLLTVPAEAARKTARACIHAGVKGILNFTTVTFDVPDEVYLEAYDMITSVEKLAYFIKQGR